MRENNTGRFWKNFPIPAGYRASIVPMYCLGMVACSDSLGTEAFRGSPLFTIRGSIESVSELPKDGEQAYASLIWTDIRRLVSTYSDPQLTPVVSSSFPSSFELALFEPARTQTVGAAKCPDALRTRVEEEGPNFQFDLSNLDEAEFTYWPLFEELDFAMILFRNLKNGADAEDYREQLPELESANAVPSSIQDYKDLFECFTLAAAIRLIPQTSSSSQQDNVRIPKPQETCFEVANIVVSNEPASLAYDPQDRSGPRIGSSLSKIRAVSKTHLVLFAPDIKRIQDDPESCFYQVENPSELKEGYNLVAVECANAEAKATFRAVDEGEEVLLSEGDDEDLLLFDRNCHPDPFAVLDGLAFAKTSGLDTPRNPKLWDLLPDAVKRAKQIEEEVVLAAISGTGVDADGRVALEAKVGDTKKWEFTFIDTKKDQVLHVKYDKESILSKAPVINYFPKGIESLFVAPIDNDSLPLIPDSDAVTREARDAGCNTEGLGTLGIARFDPSVAFDVDYFSEDGGYWLAARFGNGTWDRSNICQ